MGLTGFNMARRRELEAAPKAASFCPTPEPVAAAPKRRSKKADPAPTPVVIEEPAPVTSQITESIDIPAVDAES